MAFRDRRRITDEGQEDQQPRRRAITFPLQITAVSKSLSFAVLTPTVTAGVTKTLAYAVVIGPITYPVRHKARNWIDPPVLEEDGPQRRRQRALPPIPSGLLPPFLSRARRWVDEPVLEEDDTHRRRHRFVTFPLQVTAVTKANSYAVLTPPVAASVTKALAYAVVFSPPDVGTIAWLV